MTRSSLYVALFLSRVQPTKRYIERPGHSIFSTLRATSGGVLRVSAFARCSSRLQQILELLLVDRLVVRGSRGDLAVFVESADRSVHVDHALFDAGLDRARDLRRFSFADHVADRGRGEEDF